MRNKKGMAIATDTIIYIILAVTVLTVLLFWFNSESGRTEDIIELRNKQTDLCSRYAGIDPTCAGTGIGASSTPKSSNFNTELLQVCEKLKNYNYCGSGGNQLYCIQQCCFTCTTKPPTPK